MLLMILMMKLQKFTFKQKIRKSNLSSKVGIVWGARKSLVTFARLKRIGNMSKSWGSFRLIGNRSVKRLELCTQTHFLNSLKLTLTITLKRGAPKLFRKRTSVLGVFLKTPRLPRSPCTWLLTLQVLGTASRR